MEALESFYRTRPLDYDRHLMLIHMTRGGCRMLLQGADTQFLRDSPAAKSEAQGYQDEMQAFANFLKSRFFGEMNSKQEYLVGEAADFLGMRHVRSMLTWIVATSRPREEAEISTSRQRS